MTVLGNNVRQHHLWEGEGEPEKEQKKVLVWLSGDDSCPVRGEDERITVWPHLGS